MKTHYGRCRFMLISMFLYFAALLAAVYTRSFLSGCALVAAAILALVTTALVAFWDINKLP